jgi:hypothetical protein
MQFNNNTNTTTGSSLCPYNVNANAPWRDG